MRIDRRRLAEWCQADGPISPLAQGLIAQALFALDEIERCKRLLAVQRAEKERLAEMRWREAREDEVRSLVRLFNDDPETALAQLKRSAEGLRYLIRRLIDISNNLLHDETVYGTDRVALIQMQGHSAIIDHLYFSEVAWETFRDCLAAQPNPKPRDIEMICAADVVPKSIRDRALPLWPVDPEAARARLRAIVDRELPPLVALEAELRTAYEEPGLAAAKAMALAELARDKWALLRALRSHEAAFCQATRALEKLRRPATGAPAPLDAALATPPACADPLHPGGRPPRRRVPITPPFARPRGPAAPAPGSGQPVYWNEAGATQPHGGPACSNAHRQPRRVRCADHPRLLTRSAQRTLQGLRDPRSPVYGSEAGAAQTIDGPAEGEGAFDVSGRPSTPASARRTGDEREHRQHQGQGIEDHARNREPGDRLAAPARHQQAERADGQADQRRLDEQAGALAGHPRMGLRRQEQGERQGPRQGDHHPKQERCLPEQEGQPPGCPCQKMIDTHGVLPSWPLPPVRLVSVVGRRLPP
jgi:hypothetical protein